MNILEIYEKYQIMPTLQEHMLRVAGVAKAICDSYSKITEANEIILAALLHDMGNIVKFDLSRSKGLLNAEIDILYWQKVQKTFIEKYGPDEHIAHQLIGREIGVSGRVLELIDCIHFDKAKSNADGGDMGKKIIEYSDDRVSPLGVVSLEQRLSDLRARYGQKFPKPEDEAMRLTFENSVRKIEKQIFADCGIGPEDITEELARQAMAGLKNFEVSTWHI